MKYSTLLLALLVTLNVSASDDVLTIGPYNECFDLAAQKDFTMQTDRSWIHVSISNHYKTPYGTMIQVNQSDSSRSYKYYPGQGNNFRLSGQQTINVKNMHKSNKAHVCLDPGAFTVDVTTDKNKKGGDAESVVPEEM